MRKSTASSGNENDGGASCRTPEARYASDQTTSGRCQAGSAGALLAGARRPPRNVEVYMTTNESSRIVRWLVIIVLGAATAGMAAVSLRANYLFGYGFGQTPERAHVFGWATHDRRRRPLRSG